MRSYWGSVVIQEGMPLAEIAAELSRFLNPVRFEETDRFDEIPGFIADHSDSERFVLQGVPLDTPPDAPPSDRFNYFYFRCSESDLETLPASLRDLPRDVEVGRNGYCVVNEYLLEKLRQGTRLRCEPDL